MPTAMSLIPVTFLSDIYIGGGVIALLVVILLIILIVRNV